MKKMHKKILKATRKGRALDITGAWKIRSPDLEKDYDSRDMTQEIYTKESQKGVQMFAELKFSGLGFGVF